MVTRNQQHPEEKTHFGLLRHGITLWNEDKRIQGRMDSRLSQKGREATIRWANGLKKQRWQRIVASDLGRVKQTTELLNATLKVPISYDTRLRELDWGEWEGKRIAAIRESHPGMLEKEILAGWDFRPPGGESRREGLQRAQAALIGAACHWSSERILIVCHQGIIKCLINSISGNSFLPSDSLKIGKNRLHILVYDGVNLSISALNIPADELP